jgi:hypothetical protein
MTTTARSALHDHHLKGATPMVHSNQLTRDQLHRRWPPSDQKQQAAPIERKGDQARQH